VNKKVVLSVLSTALVSSMAASAFAAPNNGLYIGGDYKKFYNIDRFFDLTPDAKKTFYEEIGKVGFGNLVYVDHKGKGASYDSILDKGFENALNVPLKASDFADNYKVVNADGTATEDYDVRKEFETAPGDLQVESVSAITKTTYELKFSKAVDAVTAENFTIQGLTVQNAALAADKKTVTLTVAGAQASQTYSVKVSGVKVGGETQKDLSAELKVPAANELFILDVTVPEDGKVLKADGSDKTLITFLLKDKAGNVLTNVGNVEVSFNTTFGSLAEKRVTVQNGKATVILTSEFSAKDVTANVTTQIVEADDTDLIGLKKDINIIMSPNPDDVVIGQKPVIASAESNQADRVVVYFNREVTPDYFWDTTKKAWKTGVAFTVKKDVNNGDNSGVSGKAVDVLGVKAVPGNNKALEVILTKPVDASGKFIPDNDGTTAPHFPLQDNANVWVGLTDSTNGVQQNSNAPLFKLTDARQPAMLNVEVQDLKTLKVVFSESIDDVTVMNGANWQIDGKSLATGYDITVGNFDPNTGADTRGVVTIKKKTGYFTSGKHSIQASKIGDWAASSNDKNVGDTNNIANTQTLDFEVVADNNVPNATVTIHSPEQWLVDYNVAVEENAAQFASKLELQVYDETTQTWGKVTDPGLLVTQPVDRNGDIEGDKFLVEVTKDWTQVHNTKATGKNHYNFKYRLFVPKDTVTNAANGKKNVDQNLLLEDKMLYADTISPEIKDIQGLVNDTYKTKGLAYVAFMSEPVKLRTDAGFVNDENETYSETQDPALGGQGIAQVQAEFIKKDQSISIPAKVHGFVDSYDREILITPANNEGKLPAGEWKLVLRSVSDDIGNTAPTLTKEFTVEPDAVEDTEFTVAFAWADQDGHNDVPGEMHKIVRDENDDDPTADYVHVKFSKPVSVTGDEINALKTSNYTLDGRELPTGTQILADIEKYDSYDNVTDSVTIVLPDGYLRGVNEPHVLNVSKFLKSAAGDKISGELELKLAYNIEEILAAINTGTVAEQKAAKAKIAIAGDMTIDETTTFDGRSFFGNYTDALYQLDVNGNVTVTGDITLDLANLHIKGNLILDKDFIGDLNANNVTVDGKVIILGGDGNTVTFTNSKLNNIELAYPEHVVLGAGTEVTGTITITAAAKGANLDAGAATFANTARIVNNAEDVTITVPGGVEVVDAHVKAVSDAIAALPAVDKLVLADKAKVTAARAAFDKLSTSQKALVKNEATLKAAEARIADLEKPTPVDVTPINTAIDKANTAQNGVKVSVDGADVDQTEKWVTEAVKKALDDAIAAANTAKTTAKTAQEVTDAAKALDDAVATYEGAKKDGTKTAPVEPTPAEKALTAINSGTYTVEDLKTAGVTGVEDAKFDAYKAAIDAAKAAKNDDLTLAEVQDEVTKVNTPPANNPPVAKTGVEQTRIAGSGEFYMTADLLATDADADDTLTLTGTPESSVPTVATVEVRDGKLYLTPLVEGTTEVTVDVTDGTDTITATFTLTVTPQ